MSQEEKAKKVLNDEVLKGIYVDGFEFAIGRDYTVLDAGIRGPRSKETIIVARLLFATRGLDELIEGLSKALEEHKKKTKSTSQK